MKKKIKDLDKFYYSPDDLIPDLSFIKKGYDDEFNEYLYFVEYYNEGGRCKFMRDLTQKQQDFINKRFALLEVSKNYKVDKFNIKGNTRAIEDELKFRGVVFKAVEIDKKEKKIIVFNSKHTRGRVEIDEENLKNDIKGIVRVYCNDYLRKYEVCLEYSKGFINYL